MATSLSSRFLLTLGAAVALAGPAAAQTNVAFGRPVTVAAGTVSGAALSTLTDDVFAADQTSWQTGSVWWNGLTPVLEIDLGGVFNVTGIISQVDNNDTYRISFRNPGTGLYGNAFDFSPPDAFGLRTWPNVSNNEQIGLLPASVLADRIRFQAVSGDNSYSTTEIQIYGTATGRSPRPSP